MDSVLVDTDVFSFLFKGDSRASWYEPHVAGKRTCISFMSVAELLRWAITHNWATVRRQSLLDAMKCCVVLPYDFEMAEAWASVTASRARSGRPIGCGDCWIAAAALRHNLALITHNAADYSGIDGLKLISQA